MPGKTEGLPGAEALPRHATAVFFGDFLSPLAEFRAFLSQVSGTPVTGQVMMVLDPAELSLPYDGRVKFRGLEGEPDTLIPRVGSVRDAYAEALEAQQAGLAAACAAAGFGFAVHRTDHPPEAALLGLWMALDAQGRAAAPMIMFEAPVLLLALALLPVLWWLLRATPPAPRAQRFPAVRLLAALRPHEETPARTPWWLLLLRMAACALIILGLARPVLNAGHVALAGDGPALLVIDDGFAAGPDFAKRLEAAGAVLDRLERAHRKVSLLTTAPDVENRPPEAGAVMPASLLRPIVQALQPKPWPADRMKAARAVSGKGPVFYISDGLAGPAEEAFAQALSGRGTVTEFFGNMPARVLTAVATPDRLTAQLRQIATPVARVENVLAETNDGRVLARIPLAVPAGASAAEAELPLPPELRNQLGALRLAGVAGAGGVALLDEAARRRPVGLVAGGTGAETPLLGDLFYLDRALQPTTELRQGDIKTLLGRQLSMLVVAGGAISPEETEAVEGFVKHGGLLLRFAGRAWRRARRAPPIRCCRKNSLSATGSLAVPCPGANRPIWRRFPTIRLFRA